MSTPTMLSKLFEEEVTTQGGRVADLFHDERRLFARSIIHEAVPIQEGDGVEGGVAMALIGSEVSVRPYLFRLICANGAVLAQADEAVTIDLNGPDAEDRIREAIATCGSSDAFEAGIAATRKTVGMSANLGLMLVRFMQTHGTNDHRILLDVMEEFAHAPADGYGLMNAFTAVARRARTPEERWRMEETGGSIPAWLLSGDRTLSDADFLDLPVEQQMIAATAVV